MVVADICKDYRGQLMTILQIVAVAELGIKGPLDYLQV